jgi:biopolymer transport protein TolR
MSRSRRHIVEMNVVPYIDVMLVLLVIFMVTSPLMSNESKQVDTTEETSEILLKIDLKGYVSIGETPTNKTVENAEDIADTLKELLKNSKNNMITLEPNKDITFGKLEDFMIVLQSKGINVSLR